MSTLLFLQDTEENKLIYTPLHQQYCKLLEDTVGAALVRPPHSAGAA